MKLESKKNYFGIIQPILLTIHLEDGRTVNFQPSIIESQFESFTHSLWISRSVRIYRLRSDDETCYFYYIIDPEIGYVIIPPNAIQIDSSLAKVGMWAELQNFFEYMAQKHGFKLLVGLTPQSMSSFNGRVSNILRNLGWSIGPTVGMDENEEKYFHLGLHQSTDFGEGLPEFGMDPEYFIPPTVPSAEYIR